jgi:hypothetical protein
MDTELRTRRSQLYPPGDCWDSSDFEVFDGEQAIGRIYRAYDGQWFWGVLLVVAWEPLRGHVATLDDAKLRFKEAYGSWKERQR